MNVKICKLDKYTDLYTVYICLYTVYFNVIMGLKKPLLLLLGYKILDNWCMSDIFPLSHFMFSYSANYAYNISRWFVSNMWHRAGAELSCSFSLMLFYFKAMGMCASVRPAAVGHQATGDRMGLDRAVRTP